MLENLALFHCLSEYGCDASGRRTTHIPNVGAYAGRGLVLNARLAFLPDCPGVEQGCAYLRELGFGPQELCLYPQAASLFEGVRQSRAAQDRIMLHRSCGGRSELYIPGPEGWQFLNDMGFDPRCVLNQPLELRPLTDKVGLRRLARRLGLRNIFPKHGFARTREEVRSQAHVLFVAGCERVVVKHPDLASGEGQLIVASLAELTSPQAETFFTTYLSDEIELVVEEWWPGEDFSVVFNMIDENWELEFLSGQFMRAADGVTHLGNCVGSEPEDVLAGGCRDTLVAMLNRDLQPILAQLILLGYRGKICFDGKWRTGGAYKLFEANPRPSASIFPGYVMRQAMIPGERIAASMLDICLERSFSIKDACEIFGRDAYDPDRRRGAIIGNPIRLVDSEHPKLTIITVADTVFDSVAQAIAIKRRFEGVCFDQVTVPTHLRAALAA